MSRRRARTCRAVEQRHRAVAGSWSSWGPSARFRRYRLLAPGCAAGRRARAWSSYWPRGKPPLCAACHGETCQRSGCLVQSYARGGTSRGGCLQRELTFPSRSGLSQWHSRRWHRPYDGQISRPTKTQTPGHHIRSVRPEASSTSPRVRGCFRVCPQRWGRKKRRAHRWRQVMQRMTAIYLRTTTQ